MRRVSLAASLLCSVAATSGSAQSAAFNLTPHSFTKALNWYLQQRKSDKVVGCHTASGVVTCRFTHHRFRHLDRALQRVEGTGHPLSQKLALHMQLQHDRLRDIALTGDCADPVNMLTFVTTLSNIMRVFEPTLSDDDAFAAARRLGLSVDGDLAGHGKIGSVATIACRPVPAGGRRAVTCTVTPGVWTSAQKGQGAALDTLGPEAPDPHH